MAPRRKLTGAQAALFAEICEHYMSAAEDECNDTPDEVPLFSWLSPFQRIKRIKLVSEVMIGVLCENEPLPPNTIQHNAAYRALIETLFCELEIEEDTQYDHGVGDDLLNFGNDDSGTRKVLTPKEMEERSFQNDLIDYRADRNKKR